MNIKSKMIMLTLLSASVVVAGCEPRESGWDVKPDRECEFFCGDDWLDPVQE